MTSSTAGVDGVSVEAIAEKPLTKTASTLYIIAYGGTFLAVITPVVSTFAVRLSQITSNQAEAAQALGWIFGVGALITLIASPVVGLLSDRTTSRWGRRRPWLIGGSILTLASLVVLGIAPTVLVLAIGWFATQLFVSAVMMALSTFMADWVPEHNRGKVGGWVGIAQQSVPLLGIFIAQIIVSHHYDSVLLFLIPGGVGFALVIVFALVMPDKVLHLSNRTPFSPSSVLKSFWFSPKQHPDFAWAWLGRFFMAFMYAIYSVYQFYFIVFRFESNMGAAISLQLLLGTVAVIVIAIAAALSGWYSDRSRRRKNGVYVGSILFVVGFVMHAYSNNLAMFWAATIVVSIATGIYFAIDLALVTDVLPDKETRAANGMGIFNIANSLPNSIAPLVAPLVLAIGGTGENYVALWIFAAVFAILGSLTISRIRGVR